MLGIGYNVLVFRALVYAYSVPISLVIVGIYAKCPILIAIYRYFHVDTYHTVIY